MSDYLNKRGKRLVALALTDSISQQELEQNENVQKCYKENVHPGDISIKSVSQSFHPEGLNNKHIMKNTVMEYDNNNVSIKESVPMESKVDAPTISEGCSHTENDPIDNIQKCNKENVQPGDIVIPTVSQSFDSEGLNNKDIVTKNNVMEYDIDNVSITEIDPMESKVDAPTISEGHSHTENIVTKKNVMEYDNDNIFITEIDSMESKNDGSTNSDGCSCTKTRVISKSNRAKLLDYTIETDDEMDDFSPASDDDPCYKPPQETEDKISDFSDYEIEESNVSNLTRRKQRNTANWKANVTKKQRAECLPYKNKKKECGAKSPKPFDCTKCRFQCTMNFTEQDRTALCKSYWGFADYQRQKDYLIKYVVVAAPKRRRKDRSSENRSLSKMYYLENATGKHRVCANFFEKTLNISNGPINTAIKGAGPTGCFSDTDKRGRKAPGNNTSEVDVLLVKEHIDSFPVMESHYVRKHSQKLYLESGLSILKMYELYQSFCLKRNATPVKQCTYRRIFCTNYNLSFFKPKKDLCATCSKYKEASTKLKGEMETDYSLHLIRKTECQEAKAKDKIKASEDPTFITATFDLQSVLKLPYSDVSLFYYSRKICVYNLTIYLASGEAHCYTWNELHGKRGSNEIGSILLMFLQSLPATIKSVSFFCDTCGGQNRNQQVAAMLLYAVKTIEHLNQIELKFLESGHSQMECDSMHSAIESAKKHKSAFTMTDWINIFRSARSQRGKNKTNGEYIVHHLKYTDFFDLQSLASSSIKNRNKDEDGNTISWLKIKSIKVEKVSPETLFCPYDHSSEYKKVHIVGRGRRRIAKTLVLNPAYSDLLPISNAKKADLVKLVNAGHIPEELHPWYKNLPAIQLNGPECLPEPDVNESGDEN